VRTRTREINGIEGETEEQRGQKEEGSKLIPRLLLTNIKKILPEDTEIRPTS
jgi:hypothetical protein